MNTVSIFGHKTGHKLFFEYIYFAMQKRIYGYFYTMYREYCATFMKCPLLKGLESFQQRTEVLTAEYSDEVAGMIYTLHQIINDDKNLF